MSSALLGIVLLLFVIGLLPAWPYSANWGYFPSGGATLLALVVAVVLITNRRREGI